MNSRDMDRYLSMTSRRMKTPNAATKKVKGGRPAHTSEAGRPSACEQSREIAFYLRVSVARTTPCVAMLVSPSWQVPEITCTRISFPKPT
jgi:hypothetical protein